MFEIKNLRSVTALLLSVVALVFFSSCDDGSEEIEIPPVEDEIVLPDTTSVFVVNQGNFGQGNGSVSFYDEDEMSISNYIIENANDGNGIAASIESIHQHDSIGYLICNTPDKIEFFDVDDYSYLSNPTSNVSQPRYMIVVEDKAYITCWGPYSPNYTLEDSYVAVMDLSSRTIIDSLECGAGPEGIISVGSKLYIANSFESSISVIDLTDHAHSRIELDAAPQHFVLDGSDLLWVSLGSAYGAFTAEHVGLQAINTANDTKASFVQVNGLSDDGVLTVDGEGQIIYLLAAEPWPSTETAVLTFDTNTKTIAAIALISGSNFYGLGYNTYTDKIYVADAAGFAGNGSVMVYDVDGLLLNTQATAVGPFHFSFK